MNAGRFVLQCTACPTLFSWYLPLPRDLARAGTAMGAVKCKCGATADKIRILNVEGIKQKEMKYVERL